jgi:hypothetical protein
LCDLCEELKHINSGLNTNLINESKREELENRKIILEQHKSLKNERIQQFKTDKQNLNDNEIIILMDFKENFRLNKGPRELGHNFFSQPQRSLFGMMIWYKENVDIKSKNLDFFSEVLNKDSQYVKDCFTLLEDMEWFQLLQVKKIRFWMDNCGAHFKTKELFWFFRTLTEKYDSVILY